MSDSIYETEDADVLELLSCMGTPGQAAALQRLWSRLAEMRSAGTWFALHCEGSAARCSVNANGYCETHRIGPQDGDICTYGEFAGVLGLKRPVCLLCESDYRVDSVRLVCERCLAGVPG